MLSLEKLSTTSRDSLKYFEVDSVFCLFSLFCYYSKRAMLHFYDHKYHVDHGYIFEEYYLIAYINFI